MTEEELKQESEVYFKSICGDYNEEYERTGKRHYWVGFDIKNAYLAGAEPREKRIAELEAQIEKMKYALDKIIKTVQNDNISSYGDRLVKIYDISCEVLQGVKENE